MNEQLHKIIDRITEVNFLNMGNNGYWWSATEYYTDGAWFRTMDNGSNSVNRANYGKEGGLSVRCVRD